jgi:DNA-binding MarR family transcriptional regulator
MQQTLSRNRYDLLVMLTAPEPSLPSWTFLTNHAHVLIAISRNPEIRQRDIAYVVGVTVGAVQRIIHELEDGGYVRSERIGRRNRYHIIDDRPLRHPLEDQHTVSELITVLDQ